MQGKRCRRDEDCYSGTGSDGPVLGSWSAGDEEVKEVVRTVEARKQQENCKRVSHFSARPPAVNTIRV